MQKFKKSLARIFDNDLRTKQWENYPDYAIIGLIVLSTRIAWSVSLWEDSRRIAIAKKLAELLAKHIEGRAELELNPDLKVTKSGY